jgi:maltodextrin utilization protein YvdJ
MACPVCFGDSNEPMAIATNYGIWFMLGVVAMMLSAFATFFIYLMRRAKLVRDQSASGQETV